MKPILLIMAILSCATALSQFPIYYADFVKGEAWIIHSKKSRTKMSYRDFIFKEDTIRLCEGAEITLVNTSNRAVILSKKGYYSSNDIAQLYPVISRGITRLYFEQVWQQLRTGHTALSEVKKLTQALGGVRRDDNCMMVVAPIDNSIICSDTIRLEWQLVKGSATYLLRLLDHEKKELFTTSISDTQFVIRRNYLIQNPDSAYYWEVRSVNPLCTKATWQKWVWLSVSEYGSRSGQIIETVPDDHTQYYFLTVAEKLAANNFFELAAAYVIKAVNFRSPNLKY
jgi:hypothetical protein